MAWAAGESAREQGPELRAWNGTRDGARVKKVYYPPATPCDRLAAHPAVALAIKEKLAAQFLTLDPVRLLQEIRIAQQALSDIATYGPPAQQAAARHCQLPSACF